ncbi:hypothetical protein FK178_07040 [Antarcticibacterium arcticum]|uniref:Lipocalin-like domain-containing protein n=1 Tax=Antarcticibacterium arcticum TaxID=2585771 RepID=A0A5B8YIN0_9FLAO|nr:lipocalin family protein [Antarcticibacterium arcticum]QED37491.1 hypothetical protein FK178_07040 [Antarcticibacterium arcticum]
MKKFFVLFLSIALFAACSSDDDENPDAADPILGTWVLVDASSPLDDEFCLEKESTLTFNADNTGSSTFYLTQANCTATSSTGNWTNRGNSLYTISVPVYGDLQGSVNFSGSNKFTFTFIGGVLTFEK